MKRNQGEVVVQVRYVPNDEQSRAALEILQRGFRRGIIKLSAERGSKAAKDGDW